MKSPPAYRDETLARVGDFVEHQGFEGSEVGIVTRVCDVASCVDLDMVRVATLAGPSAIYPGTFVWIPRSFERINVCAAETVLLKRPGSGPAIPDGGLLLPAGTEVEPARV